MEKLSKEEMFEAVKQGIKEAFHEMMDSGDGFSGPIRFEEIKDAISKGVTLAFPEKRDILKSVEFSTSNSLKDLKLKISSLDREIKKESCPDLMTIRQFCRKFSWPSESAMRSYLFRAKELGLSSAFIRCGRRVLVSSSEFFKVIKKVQNQKLQSYRKS